jgi:16S rRNA (adenine1518-N6/adenine1519-N6)-dimethyltransferase
MQRLGQHFLKNQSVLVKIVKALGLVEGDSVIEIGPGHGELTIPLAAACEKLGVNIIAIEKDAELAKQITATKVITGDALKVLPGVVGELKTKNYKLVGNIPYYITGKLLRVIGDLEKKPGIAVLMLQKEVAERICAEPPDMNRLAASIQFWGEPKIITVVPKEDFSPKPEVDSAVIVIKTKASKPKIEAERYYAAVRALFAQPRKMIVNNLFDAKKELLSKIQATELLNANNIDEKHRPQDLSVENIIAIAKGAF